MTVRRTDTY